MTTQSRTRRSQPVERAVPVNTAPSAATQSPRRLPSFRTVHPAGNVSRHCARAYPHRCPGKPIGTHALASCVACWATPCRPRPLFRRPRRRSVPDGRDRALAGASRPPLRARSRQAPRNEGQRMTDGVMLARAAPGLAGDAQRATHVFPVPATPTPPRRITALCGVSFGPGQLERLDGPTGMPCERCLARAPQESAQPQSSGERLNEIERTLHQLQVQVNGIRTLLAATVGTPDWHNPRQPRREESDGLP